MAAINKRVFMARLGDELDMTVRAVGAEISVIADIMRKEVVKGKFDFPGFMKIETVYQTEAENQSQINRWVFKATHTMGQEPVLCPTFFRAKASLYGVHLKFITRYFEVLVEHIQNCDTVCIANVGTFRKIKYGKDAGKVFFGSYLKITQSTDEHNDAPISRYRVYPTEVKPSYEKT